jgi:hypothetical protein
MLSTGLHFASQSTLAGLAAIETKLRAAPCRAKVFTSARSIQATPPAHAKKTCPVNTPSIAHRGYGE